MRGQGVRKPDADEIVAFMRQLPAALALSGGREVWPQFLFHSTDLDNAISILNDEVLLCRTLAKSQHRMSVDSAHQEIIQQTETRARNCVRLYFRPRTPTNYRNEGFRSDHDPDVEPHGITVMFVLDAGAVMTMAETEFTNGNAARTSVVHGGNVEFLRSIPFAHVYHEGRIPDDLKDKVVFHRNAEVLVPEKLALKDSLRFVMVRSDAELQTLLFRLRDLGPTQFHSYSTLCRVNRKTALSNLFFRKWTFVDQVAVADGVASFRFSPDTQSPGPFDVEIVVLDALTRRPLSSVRQRSMVLSQTLQVRLPQECRSAAFTLELQLHGRLAFQSSYAPSDSIIW